MTFGDVHVTVIKGSGSDAFFPAIKCVFLTERMNL